MQPADKVVAYYYDEESSDYSYNYVHPWRPIRSKLVHTLITGYGLQNQMVIHRPTPRTHEQLTEVCLAFGCAKRALWGGGGASGLPLTPWSHTQAQVVGCAPAACAHAA